MIEVIKKWRKVKESSNEAIGWLSMAAVNKDRRYLEVIEKLGQANDDMINLTQGLIEEMLTMKQEMNNMRYFKEN